MLVVWRMSSEDSLGSLGAKIDSYVKSSSETDEEVTYNEWSYQDLIEGGVVTLARPSLEIPTEAIPLRSLPAIGESSDYPSTSEPTNLLSKNPASRMTGKMLRELSHMYRFPESLELRVPSSNERIDYKVPGYVGFYVRSFFVGLRFPIPRLVWEVLNHFEIAPSQLMPNA